MQRIWVAVAALMLAVCGAAAAPAAAPAPAAPAAPAVDNTRNVYQTPTTYSAAYHYLTCATSVQEAPTSTAEVAAIVAKYHKVAAGGTPVTVRTSRPRFHSTATFVCPVSPAAAAPAGKPAKPGNIITEAGKPGNAGKAVKGAPLSVGVLQSKLNKVLAVDRKAHTMRVGAGMTITQFLQEATKAGMSVQIGTLTAYAGLSLAGVLATSAHGSGDGKPSSLADTVLEVTWVDGTGKVHTSRKGDPEFKAFNGGVGVFGVITELLISLTPPTHTQLITVTKSDKNMMKEIAALLKVAPSILIHWRPDAGQFKAFLVRPAPAKATKVNNKVQMTVLPSVKGQPNFVTAFTTWHTSSHDDSDMMAFMCPQIHEQSLGASWASAPSAEMALAPVANVTGPTNSLQAAECDENCLWNDRNVFNGTAMDAEFTIEHEQLPQWIEDVKRIFALDLKAGGKAKYRCMGLGYMWIRFGRNYDGVTATTTDMKRPVYVQSTWLRSRVAPSFNMRFQYVVDLVEELTLCKFKGRPHWGKNFDRTFLHRKCPVAPLYPKFQTLVNLAAKHDPAGMFKPRLFDGVARQGGADLFPGCAALMKCYCSADVHCRPTERCVPSAAFPEFKICRPADEADKPGTLLAKMMA